MAHHHPPASQMISELSNLYESIIYSIEAQELSSKSHAGNTRSNSASQHRSSNGASPARLIDPPYLGPLGSASVDFDDDDDDDDDSAILTPWIKRGIDTDANAERTSYLDIEVDTMRKRLAMLETQIREQQCMHEESSATTNMIQRLIPCAEYGSFECFIPARADMKHHSGGSFLYMIQSKDLVRNILTCFAAGVAYNMSGEYSIYSHSSSADNDDYDDYESSEEGRYLFRKKLLMQLKHLIGHSPYLEEEEDGSYTLYYC